MQDLRLLEEYFILDHKVALPSAIQKYGKVKNKRLLNSVSYIAVQRFSKHFGSVGKHKGSAFYFTDVNV